jgi:hypothetical protein
MEMKENGSKLTKTAHLHSGHIPGHNGAQVNQFHLDAELFTGHVGRFLSHLELRTPRHQGDI